MYERKNEPENLFDKMASAKGWNPTKRGWPDFLCWDDDGPFCVEVKPQFKGGYGQKQLRKEQAATMRFLEAAGIRCYISDGVNMDRFDPKFHDNPERRRNGRVKKI